MMDKAILEVTLVVRFWQAHRTNGNGGTVVFFAAAVKDDKFIFRNSAPSPHGESDGIDDGALFVDDGKDVSPALRLPEEKRGRCARLPVVEDPS